MWGYKDGTAKGVLQERENITYVSIIFNPTFRCAPCGAEIRRSLRNFPYMINYIVTSIILLP
ncbi:hypothetical protein Barb6_03384 [Bacteroidales bacterium Barb6]|nr:hypothetical protein Barb6_03384 [Bacteroidales bacterium Barb6]